MWDANTTVLLLVKCSIVTIIVFSVFILEWNVFIVVRYQVTLFMLHIM